MAVTWDNISRALTALLGLGIEPKELSTVQIILRGLIVFGATIWMVRVGDKRFLARKTAYDAVLGFILASMLARAVNGSAPFFPTLVSGFVLVLAHRFLSFCAARWHPLGVLLKGRDVTLIENGSVNESTLRGHNLSERDLQEDLRLAGVESAADVKSARLERNGDISVIKSAG